MQTTPTQSRRLRDYTNTPFEIFVAALTALPFLALAYFYPAIPERVPLFLTLGGEVETWGSKSLLSVFRVPLMALVTQLFCLSMKYGALKSEPAAPFQGADARTAESRERYLGLWARLWDCFRCAAAIKMSAASLNTVFLSVGALGFLSRPAYAVTAAAALLSAAGALFYGYRLLAVRRELRGRHGDLNIPKPPDGRRVYAGLFYFDPSDPSPFARGHLLNLANGWAWVFVACLLAYPLLVFLPA